jgi:hypothetical protein
MEYADGCGLDVIEEPRLGFGNGDEGERHSSKPLVSVTHSNQHGGLAENAMDGFRITALKQLPFILKYEVVQLLVTRHHRGRQEQMRFEHFAIPEKYCFLIFNFCVPFMRSPVIKTNTGIYLYIYRERERERERERASERESLLT